MLTCLRQCNDLRGWGKFRAWSPLGALGNCAICFRTDHKHRHYRIDLRPNEATGQGGAPQLPPLIPKEHMALLTNREELAHLLLVDLEVNF